MSRRPAVTIQKKKRRRNPLLPIFGLILALAFGLFAYLLTPSVRGFLSSRGVSFGGVSASTLDLLIAGAIWLVMFMIAMMLVALFSGRSVDEDQAIKFAKQAAKERERQQMEREAKRRRQMEIRRRQSSGRDK
jgi:Zn-dependent protease with chaperone function